MGKCGRCSAPLRSGANKRTRCSLRVSPPRPAFLGHRVDIDRKSLVPPMALTSTLVPPSLVGSAPTAAADCAHPSSPVAISDTHIVTLAPCINEGPLTNRAGNDIYLSTTGESNFVGLANIGGILKDITQRVVRPLVVAVVAAVATFTMTPTMAADFDGNCCTDLEDRVAELEATVARKGNRKVKFKFVGEVATALLFWDDGGESDAYVVTNENGGTAIEMEGEAELEGAAKGWTLGFAMAIDILTAGSDEVNQLSSAPIIDDRSDKVVEPGDVLFFVKNEHLGTVAVGVTSARGKTDGANEADLSETDVASFVNQQDVGGGFFLRGPDGLIDVAWGDLIDALDEPDGSIIAYNTPEMAGFTFYGWWGNDRPVCLTHCFLWNIGVTYTKEFGEMFEVAAGLATNKNIGDDFVEDEIDELDNTSTVGSISVLHKPSGFSLSFATGRQNFLTEVELNDGETRTPDDPTFYYVKAGLRREFIELGETAFYADYGRYKDSLGIEAGPDIVGAFGGIDEEEVCEEIGLACLVSGTTATTWGFGVVQNIETDELRVFLGFRHFEVDVDLIDSDGGRVSTVQLRDWQAVMTGLQIEF